MVDNGLLTGFGTQADAVFGGLDFDADEGTPAFLASTTPAAYPST
jgi:hypothetical protein